MRSSAFPCLVFSLFIQNQCDLSSASSLPRRNLAFGTESRVGLGVSSPGTAIGASTASPRSDRDEVRPEDRSLEEEDKQEVACVRKEEESESEDEESENEGEEAEANNRDAELPAGSPPGACALPPPVSSTPRLPYSAADGPRCRCAKSDCRSNGRCSCVVRRGLPCSAACGCRCPPAEYVPSARDQCTAYFPNPFPCLFSRS